MNLQVISKASRLVIPSSHSSIRLLVWSYRGPLELTVIETFEGRVIETSQLIQKFYQRTSIKDNYVVRRKCSVLNRYAPVKSGMRSLWLPLQFPRVPSPLEMPQNSGIPTLPAAPTTAAGISQTRSGNLSTTAETCRESPVVEDAVRTLVVRHVRH